MEFNTVAKYGLGLEKLAFMQREMAFMFNDAIGDIQEQLRPGYVLFENGKFEAHMDDGTTIYVNLDGLVED